MLTLDKMITRQQNAIALEGIEQLTDYIKRFHNPRLYDLLKGRLNTMFVGKSLQGSISPSVNSKVTKWLIQVGYPNLKEFTVFVPVGLTSDVGTYLNALESNSAVMHQIIDDLIAPTTNLFSLLYNQPEILLSRSGVTDNMVDAPLVKMKLETLAKPLATCFNANSPSDQVSFQQAYQRVGDFDNAAKRVSALQDEIGRTSPESIKKAAQQLFDTASLLAKELRSNHEYSNVSKVVSDQLADRLYICARWIEFYGVHIDQVNTLAVAISDTETKINKIR